MDRGDREKLAKEKALRLLSFRDHSRAELFDKLCLAGFSEQAGSACEEMRELGYINDAAYAEKKLMQLLEDKYYSLNRAIYELKGKGISSEIIEELLIRAPVDDRDQIRAFIFKKYPVRPDEVGTRRMISALSRRGFLYEDIRAVLAETEDTHGLPDFSDEEPFDD